MNPSMQNYESDVIEQAMAAFLLQAVNAKSKSSKIKANMECRRKLEIKWEERRLKREISEFDFN
ncbi:hypothetical protein GCM10011613_10700 [Cellvibrio zantedeschiae]|uniref:Uncharacterized protein n=1 Tax=Cellvibrio zantedeschiae TaxID=1237077 RepID=A0ABQ3AYQ5_9GAMM|nr:hypothetical protein [Cellvibrio zantedeschiae]GGY68346.1 hypothetical protein GCM10011613_10700 [Cellvibrio zantedeschiae]